MPIRERAFGAEINFIGTDHTLAVSGIEPLGGNRIKFSEFLSKRLRPDLIPAFSYFFSNLSRNFGNVRQPFHQSSNIETGATGNDRQSVRPPACLDFCYRKLSPNTGRTRLCCRNDAIKLVRYFCLVFGRRPGRDQAQLAINLHGITIDDNAVIFIRRRQSETGFSTRRRPSNDQNGFLRVSRHGGGS